MENNNYQKEVKEKSIKDYINDYLKYWYLFVLGVFIAMVIAFIYLRYTPKLYQSRATIIIKDEKSGDSPIDMAGFSQFSGFLSKFNSSKIENELALFNSKRIILKTVKELNLNVNYELVGAIRTTELYKFRPFNIQFQSFSAENVPQLIFNIVSNAEFTLGYEGKETQKYKFGEQITVPFGTFTVLPNIDKNFDFNNFKDKTIAVNYRPEDLVALNYQTMVNVQNEIKNSNVVELTIQTPVTQKAEDFLNELISQYNQDAINDRNQIAKNTSQFIDSRLAIITRELDSVERNKEQFKSSNRLTDIQAESQIILQNASEFNKKQLDISTQLELSKTMIAYIENSSKNDLLPVNIGIDEEQVAESVNNYNQLILYRNKLLQTSTQQNPVVENVNAQIDQMRSSILGSLKNSSNALKIVIRDINSQENILNSKISQVPAKEKIFRGIERQQTIKEQLYLFLLQQREQASITLAATSPKAKIVDSAYSSKTPVTPQTSIIYIGALLGGILFPFLIIYGREMLNTKITTRRDLEKHIASVTILGEIPKVKKGEDELIQHNDMSILAESFRILRTNLQYLFINKLAKNDKAKTIIVTSTIKGEGKTFVAFNLALTLATTGKRVALVGADIRNPQLQRYLPKKLKNRKGLTEFIVYDDVTVDDVINKSQSSDNLSIVLSGAIPPNPAEMLMQDKTRLFFEQLKEKFDYIILDSAPTLLVTDTLLINSFADITIYVTRAGVTDKQLLNFPLDAIEDGRLSNVAMVLNDVTLSNFGYGNKYGYTYDSSKKTLFQRMFNR